MKLHIAFLSSVLVLSTVTPSLMAETVIAQTQTRSIAGTYQVTNHQGYFKLGPMRQTMAPEGSVPSSIITTAPGQVQLTQSGYKFNLSQLPSGSQNMRWSPSGNVPIDHSELTRIAGQDLTGLRAWQGQTSNWLDSGFPATMTLIEYAPGKLVGAIVGEGPDTEIVRYISLLRG